MDEQTNYGLLRNLLNARQMTPGEESHPTNTSAESQATESDALRAILWVGAFVDQLYAEGEIDLERTEMLSSLLLIARDYILPIPSQQDPQAPGVDLAAPRLAAAIKHLRNLEL